MTITEYIDFIATFLESNINLYARIEIGRLTSDLKSIAIRIMPSGNTKHYDSTRARDISFQILTKSNNHSEAISALEDIAFKLQEIGVEVYSEPSYLYEDEQGYIYTSAYRDILDK